MPNSLAALGTGIRRGSASNILLFKWIHLLVKRSDCGVCGPSGLTGSADLTSINWSVGELLLGRPPGCRGFSVEYSLKQRNSSIVHIARGQVATPGVPYSSLLYS